MPLPCRSWRVRFVHFLLSMLPNRADIWHPTSVLSSLRWQFTVCLTRRVISDARSTGYGVVLPSREEMTLRQPELTKKGASFGVRLKATAPSIHMIRVDADAEIRPMVGSEDQSRDLMAMLSGEPEQVLDSNLFGKSVYDMVREGLGTKLLLSGPEVREKFRQSLSKIINEGAQGLICIIL